ncbi:MAG: Hpt domain-containing protein, partial [Gemmatimonadaceae bacterium]
MSSSSRVLDYFVVEASECIERLDGLLAAGATHAPDPDALLRTVKALRGSATMAHQQPLAELAAGAERVARGVRDGRVQWGVSMHATLVATVDDFRILLRDVRTWSAADDERAGRRTRELAALAPDVPPSRLSTTPAGDSRDFLSAETADLARALEQCASPSAPPDAVAAATERVRALRGVAEFKDLPPLGEVLEGVDTALRPLESPSATAATVRQRALFAAASVLLRRASRELASRARPDPDAPELAEFRRARAVLQADGAAIVRIIPISHLFHDDVGPHVISAAAHPPTTADERFRLEVVSLAEHVRGVIADARAHPGEPDRERVARDMRGALRALGSTANSFGQKPVARFAATWSVRVGTLDSDALAAIDAAATLLANPASSARDLVHGLDRFAAPATPAPASATSADPRARMRTPTGGQLHDLLQRGIASFAPLEARPLTPSAPLPDEQIVPIEQLLYRGRRALE